MSSLAASMKLRTRRTRSSAIHYCHMCDSFDQTCHKPMTESVSAVIRPVFVVL